jgi:hypothetical protein
MKIAILTHPLGTNYGGILQNYALQYVLKSLGHEPITLNHYFKTAWYVKVMSFVKRLSLRIKGRKVSLRAWMTKQEYDKITYNTETSETGNVYTMPDTMYQVNKIIGCDYRIIGKEITFDENYKGDVEIYYYKYPELIAEDEDDDTYTFELDQDALEILPFGVAGDMLKSDPSTNYGAYYSNRYNELKQYLDSRLTNGIITIEDGVDI